MQTLRFDIKKQHIELQEQPYLVAGTRNGYLSCQFSFDGSWSGYNKVAIFDSKEIRPIINGRCEVPNSIAELNRFSVKVMGERNNVCILTDFAVVNQR